VRDFNLPQILQSANLGLFNKVWEVVIHSDPSFIRIPQSLELGHMFTLSKLLHFILRASHVFFPLNGLKEALEKIEFSKGTEQARV
jgi:hypothetical protein